MKYSAQDVLLMARTIASSVAPKYGFDPEQIAQFCTAIAFIESTYNSDAQAPAPHTAKGLMQINDRTKIDAEKLAGVSPAPLSLMFNAEYSLMLGMHIFCARMKKCGSVDKGVIAYNQGNCGVKALVAGAGYLRKWKKAMQALRTTTTPDVVLRTPGLTTVRAFY